MDAISIAAAALLAGGVYAGTYGEFEYNVQPSVFPPIDGPSYVHSQRWHTHFLAWE